LLINFDGATHLLDFRDMLVKKEDGTIAGEIRRYQAYSILDDEIKNFVDDLITKRKTNEKV